MVRSEVRRVSKALLGNAYLLEVSAAISGVPDGLFYTRELAQRLQLTDNLVAPALKRLEDGGLLKRRPKSGSYQEFERVPSVFWRLSQELLKEVTSS